MPRKAVKTTIGNPFTELSTVDSTNIYAMEQIQANLAVHGAAFFAREQTAGKGQRGKHWEAVPGENILLSVVLNTQFLVITQQFHLSVMVALACYDFLELYITDELSIKWPNDLYWRDRKTAGILIETSLSGNKWPWAVAGIIGCLQFSRPSFHHSPLLFFLQDCPRSNCGVQMFQLP